MTKYTDDEIHGFNLNPHTYLAFVDMLGVSEASTGKSSLNYIIKSESVKTTQIFASDMCCLFKNVEAHAFSDSHVLISNNLESIVNYLKTLFQVSCINNDFRLRAGLEIGNFESFQVENPPNNYFSSKVIFGDALTNAYRAEGSLKGSRIACGARLTEIIGKGMFAKNDINSVFHRINTKSIDSRVAIVGVPEACLIEEAFAHGYEVKWIDNYTQEQDNLMRKRYDELNRIDSVVCRKVVYPYPDSKKLKDRIEKWKLQAKNEEYYPQMMLGLMYSWGLLK